MEFIKRIITQRFELIFVSVLLLGTAFINYFVQQKLAFLDFYFLPVIFAANFLGARQAVVGAVLSGLLVGIYVYIDPTGFLAALSKTHLYTHLLIWAFFLVLAGATVGRLGEKVAEKVVNIERINTMLKTQQEQVKAAHDTLKDYSENLERKVTERTQDLERSSRALESLKSKVENALYSTMDSDVVKLMIEGRLRTEKRQISVMFTDLANFTGYTEETSPDLVIRDLNKYLSTMEPIILGFHGHIDKFLGDGLMCEFGAPLDFETYRLLAVLSALTMQERMQELGLPWRVRIGIGSGLSILGLIGNRRQSYTAIGDVVNIASRLEKSCPPGGVVVDEKTYEGIKQYVNAVPLLQLPQAHDAAEMQMVQAKVDDLLRTMESASDADVKADLALKIGYLYVSVGEKKSAAQHFATAVRLRPDAVESNQALADAVAEQSEGLLVKGRKKPVKAHQILGLKDPLEDAARFPSGFAAQYGALVDKVGTTDDLVLRCEALDGTIGHSRVVAALSCALADSMSDYGSEKREILTAANYADIGKQVIAHHILNRHGPLTSAEMVEVRKHPAESVRILKTLGFTNTEVFRLIEHSHDRYDGLANPDGLAGDEIPLGSRIIAVADAFDALTAWRPYREGWVVSTALDELRAGAASGQFDAKVVSNLASMLARKAA